MDTETEVEEPQSPEEEAPVQEPVQTPAPSREMRVVTEQAYPRGMNFKYVRPRLEAELGPALFQYLNNGQTWRVRIEHDIVKGDLAGEPGMERWEMYAIIEPVEG